MARTKLRPKAAPKAKASVAPKGKAAPKTKASVAPKGKAAPEAKQANAKPVKAKPAKAKLAKAKRGEAKLAKAKLAKAKLAKAKRGEAKLAKAKLAKAKLAKAKLAKATPAKATSAAKARPAATAKSATKPTRATTKSAPEGKPPQKRTATHAVTEAMIESVSESSDAVPAPIESVSESSDAVPAPIAGETSTEAHRRLFTARDRSVRSSPVVEILDDPHPMSALRRFLDSVKGEATPQQAQIALGAAQLMLLPMGREHRGGQDVKDLVDLIVHHWEDFGERRKGFHAQEFLRNAFVALGVERERVARLEGMIPETVSSELLFNLACAYAVARDKVAMLRSVERALEAGASPGQFRRDPDFAPYANDPDLTVVLARAEVPHIPVDVEPYLPAVRGALDSLLTTLKEFGESVELRPPMRLEAVLDAERAGKISLPNDYRALLTITNGMRLWEHEFFGAGDFFEHTRLAARAQQYLGESFGVTGIVECVPLASWGQPNDWLLYDPRGRLRSGTPGYVLMLSADEVVIEDLATALAHMENLAREVLGTN